MCGKSKSQGNVWKVKVTPIPAVIPAEAGGQHTLRITLGEQQRFVFPADTVTTCRLPSVQLRNVCLEKMLGGLKASTRTKAGK